MTVTNNWRRVMTVVFWVVVALVAAAQLWIVIQGVFFMRLWEDEAFNLTVPLNLVHGLGYTSDGTLSGSQLTPFDPRISTGPVVLLPIAAVIALGADPVIGGRLVVLLFYAALVAGLWLLGGRLGGRWAALAAVCVPLGWNTWNSGSPIQSPVDILGEVPAAALLVWAFIVLRKYPWLAGVLIGLAMQTKLLGALAAIPIALAIYLLSEGGFVRRALRVVLCALVAVIPNVLYELWKLVALGPSAYWLNLKEFYWFFTSGGQNIDPVDPTKKLVALGDGWFSPTWLTVIFIVLVLAAVCVFVLRRPMPENSDSDGVGSRREQTAYALAAIVGLVIWFGWWLTSTHTPNWPRYPAMAMYIFVPIIVAVAIRALSEHWNTRPWGVGSRIASAAVAAVIVIALGMQMWGHVQVADKSRFGESLADQRVAAAEVADVELDVIVTAWGPTVSIIVLAGAHAALNDVPDWDGTPELWKNWDTSDAGMEAFDRRLSKECTGVPVQTDLYALCVVP
ncbi:glycosyltransferase family 39 protein [Paramicrobacterium fandaimingii]|uniref:glycosyltransferase family 39 protein n=1 Tax=Paramicrobacterium fandaimingii TaxID=2708079 RepID=UPI001420926F|nr:glycosyltransferase family 39 protein [Microbacterium fandaimingii]